MVFEYILKKNGIVQPLLHFPVVRQTIPSNLNRALLPLKLKMPVMSLLLSVLIPAMSRTPHTVPKQVI